MRVLLTRCLLPLHIRVGSAIGHACYHHGVVQDYRRVMGLHHESRGHCENKERKKEIDMCRYVPNA